MASALDQFDIKNYGKTFEVAGFDFGITNSAIAMLTAIILIMIMIYGGSYKQKLIPDKWQLINEIFYRFIAKMIDDNVGAKGQKFFPLIFSLFMFILFGNMLGLLPYSFTFTSHIIITFSLASFVFILVTITGIIKQGWKFLDLFIPKGISKFMLPLMIPIELLSYLSRPVSLSLRLFANMVAGHIMLKVFAGFVITLGVFGFVPLAASVALHGFELLIAFLQAYVFTVLTCLYLHDALELH